ncbi:peptidylprolyl isomerase [Candidatus Peregrinibacteria bacterium]|nr:peptidylprolyl isomerase [Candidatus Peregrinibacteria bacterium]
MKKVSIFLMALSFVLLTACGTSPEEELSKVFQDGPSEAAMTTTNPDAMPVFNQTAPPEAGDQIAVIETNMGTIKIKLFPLKAPKTVENFVGLIEKGYYDGIIFHRVIPDFMIQGGDPTGTGMGGESLWGGKFEDEFHPDLKNIQGALSMANAGPNTNGSQFFIVHAEATPWLDGHHTVFGQVFEGMDVVDAIANVERDGRDKPTTDVVMKKVMVEVFE